jgi:hypothetical protein
LILKAILIVALVRVLMLTDKPLLCSGLYTAVVFLLGMAFGAPMEALLIGAVIAFLLSSLYFWLLSRFEDSGLLWWVILIAGLVIGLV